VEDAVFAKPWSPVLLETDEDDNYSKDNNLRTLASVVAMFKAGRAGGRGLDDNNDNWNDL
jgi:hypothetical protein